MRNMVLCVAVSMVVLGQPAGAQSVNPAMEFQEIDDQEVAPGSWVTLSGGGQARTWDPVIGDPDPNDGVPESVKYVELELNLPEDELITEVWAEYRKYRLQGQNWVYDGVLMPDALVMRSTPAGVDWAGTCAELAVGCGSESDCWTVAACTSTKWCPYSQPNTGVCWISEAACHYSSTMTCKCMAGLMSCPGSPTKNRFRILECPVNNLCRFDVHVGRFW